MEGRWKLGKRFDVKSMFFVGLLCVFLIYLVIGFYPADATNYKIVSRLSIPSVGILTDVAELKLTNGKLDTPDSIVGSYSKNKNKVLLIGHSTTVFSNLYNLTLRSQFYYNNKTYKVVAIDVVQKTAISMEGILKTESKDTVLIMTCAGTLLGNGDATHRLIITGVAE